MYKKFGHIQMFSLFASPTNRNRQYYQDETRRLSRKKAFVVGLNYFETEIQLTGCNEDANSFADFLKLKYHVTDINVIFDGNDILKKHNFINALDEFLIGVIAGDVLFFHFAGIFNKDKNSFMLTQNEMIHLDELKSCLLDPLPIGATLILLFDCGVDSLGLRFKCEDNSKGPQNSQIKMGRRISSVPLKWMSDKKLKENIQISETSSCVVSFSATKRSLSWAFLQTIDQIYAHSLSLSMMLSMIRAHMEANDVKPDIILETGQLIDLAVPFGRIIGSPI